ncbi:hypothetical protein OBBRIDRAFT_790108 [Obba rivulosa]|uniref:DUF6533 domain-containing protein n=1 Tax=Obba rivulosa TaxID=1052685 RepID=A0A8E2DPX2_9APHY|nr:hypothetical protein OBBRIDRAFT_790108 [Obba rivulosa]
MSDAAEELISYLQTNFVTACCVLAPSVLVIYDHIMTLPREVELIWGRQWTSVTFLYHLNRWTIFIWAMFEFTGFIQIDTLPVGDVCFSHCVGSNYFFDAVVICLLTIWTAFSGVRMYAISGGNWWLAVAVCALSMVQVGTNAYGWFAAVWFEIDFIPDIGMLCEDGSKLSTAAIAIGTRVCALAADVLILVMTWIKTYAIKRDADRNKIKAPLATLLIKDGIMLLSLDILNIAGWGTNVSLYIASVKLRTQLGDRLSSVIISHFLLDLRRVACDDYDNRPDGAHLTLDRSQHSSLRFASFVDNMGEQLSHDSDSSDPDMSWAGHGSDAGDDEIADFPPAQSSIKSGNISTPGTVENGLWGAGPEQVLSDMIEIVRR